MHCQDKTILRAIARKLRKKANALDALAYEQEERDIAKARDLIEPLLLPIGRGGVRTTSADRAYLLALSRLRQAGL